MKVLFAPYEIAGQSSLLARTLRSHGVQALSLAYSDTKFNYVVDRNLHLNKVGSLERAMRMGMEFLRDLDFNIYHFQFGLSFFPQPIDIPILKLLRKKLIMHYHGDDLRQLDLIRKHQYNYAQYVTYSDESEEKKRRRYEYFKRYVDKIFVSTPDLLNFTPTGEWLPLAIDVDYWQQLAKKNIHRRRDKKIRILHAPTDRLRKGTQFVIKAMDALRKLGENVELILLENIPHAKVAETYAEADIAIDQLLVGSYGTFAIEAMALGKPVLCYLREDVKKFYPTSLPIIHTTPDTLVLDIRRLIRQEHRWKEWGQRGQEYVRNTHDAEKIAERLISVYHCLLADS